MSKSTWTVEERFTTMRARDLADEAIDDLPASAPMTEYLDTWLRVYREAGGREKVPR